jgi:hypothetical protein
MSWKHHLCCRAHDTTDGPGAGPPAAMPDASPRAPRRRLRVAAGLLAIALIGGCSSVDQYLSSQPQPGGSQTSFSERFRKLLGNDSETPATTSAAAPAATTPPGTGTPLSSCPPVTIRRGASTLQMTAPGSDNAMAVRYQATFGQTARQCAEVDGNLTIKVGVQGRLILGPAGASGETTLPLRYALVKEGMEPQTLWSKLYLVPVTIPTDDANIPFTHVVEDMVVPMPPNKAYGNYVIYVGFDPKGAEQQKPQRKRRRKSH